MRISSLYNGQPSHAGEATGTLLLVSGKDLLEISRPRIHALHWRLHAYRVCGGVGFGLAVVLAITMVLQSGYFHWVMVAVIPSAVLTFLALAMITKIVTGEERITYYHHFMAVTLVTAIVLHVLRLPVLAYLDVTTLGIGLFLAFGRLGCLRVGCCHGRPHRWGVTYGPEHAACGFPRHLVGVRLFPVQAMESLWVFALVGVGCILITGDCLPGDVFAWYVVAYGIGRFCFEFVRGDAARAYLWGFSEAQWTSLLLMSAVVSAELCGWLPFQAWHTAATAGVMFIMISVSVARHLQTGDRFRLLHPRHIREVAEIVGTLFDGAAEGTEGSVHDAPLRSIPVLCTSQGIRISAGRIETSGGDIEHYTLSRTSGVLASKAAQALTGLILRLTRQTRDSSELIRGNRGAFHLAVHCRDNKCASPQALAGPNDCGPSRRSGGTQV